MLTVESLKKSYDDTRGRASGRRSDAGTRVFAVGGVDFEVHDGELFTLLGPSAAERPPPCAPSRALNADGGPGDTGRARAVRLQARCQHARQPARTRHVFQSYAIWPHMSVFKNVSFPLEVMPRAKRPRPQGDRGPRRPGPRGHRARRLRGPGRHQALRRPAAAPGAGPRPGDPAGADAPGRTAVQSGRQAARDDAFQLKRLQRELNLTAIYVTHDQSEALVMSNRIAVMNQGRIEQSASPARSTPSRPRGSWPSSSAPPTSSRRGRLGVGR